MYPVNIGYPSIPSTPLVPPPGMLYATSYPANEPVYNPYMAAADLVRLQQPVAVENYYSRPLDVRMQYDQFQRLNDTLNTGFNSVNRSLMDIYNYLGSIYKYGLPVREY